MKPYKINGETSHKSSNIWFVYFFQVLYTYPENFRAYKALIAAQYSGADVKVAPNFVFGETNKTDAFLKKFPAGKVSDKRRASVVSVISDQMFLTVTCNYCELFQVPAYESADGKVLLTESNAIAYYGKSCHDYYENILYL